MNCTTIITNDKIQNQKNNISLHIVCRNEDSDVKLTVGDRPFHGFITRPVKKFDAAHHWYIEV